MTIPRRTFLKLAGLTTVSAGLMPEGLAGETYSAGPKADYTINIGTGLIDLGPEAIVSTTTYNGQFPGPLIRLKEGQPVTVDFINHTDTPEQFHWHGQKVPVDVDGSSEEGTPFIPAHGSRRISFVPRPAGFRFYHTHLRAGDDLTRGQYSGQVGPVYIEPRHEPGRYDKEVFLVLKEFDPFLSRGGDMSSDFLRPSTKDKQLKEAGETAMRKSLAEGMPHGYEVGYRLFSINGRMLGHGEPIRVKQGERVLFHILNGSATEIRSLHLPGHSFEVVALDGNPVPTTASVPVLWLGTAERISAIVKMNNPGVWTLGDLSDDDRRRGMGVVVEYAGHKGNPQWSKPKESSWDYRIFGKSNATIQEPDESFDMTFAKANAADRGFNQWTINGTAYRMNDSQAHPMFSLHEGKRYRIRMRNASDDTHPIHLHRHTFELTNIAGNPTSGILKDVVMLGGYQRMDIDFVADNPGMTLFHCHQQMHMDFGFMALFAYV